MKMVPYMMVLMVKDTNMVLNISTDSTKFPPMVRLQCTDWNNYDVNAFNDNLYTDTNIYADTETDTAPLQQIAAYWGFH